MSSPEIIFAPSRLRLVQACDRASIAESEIDEAAALADKMSLPVHQALARLEQALEHGTEFYPERLQRTFRILVSDVGAVAPWSCA